MRYGSVCSGIEAATVAWHPLGWKPSFFSEIEAFPRAVLQHHYPHVPLHGDFTTIKGDEYDAIDLLVGGTPCQSFSVAGLRGGLADERGNLALEYLRLADRTRPRWLVWENVPGVLSSNGGRDFGAILGGMVELGYGFAYRVLDAQYVRVDGFGRAVPQRRRRVFVVGYLGDWRCAAAVLFERQSLRGDPAPRREAGEGFTYDAAPCLTSSGRGVERMGETRGQDPVVAMTLNAKGGAGRIDAESETFVVAPPLTRNPYGDHESREGLLVAHSLRGEGFDASEDGTGRGTPLVPVAFDARQSDVLIYGDKSGPLDTDAFSQGVVHPYTLAIRGRGDSHQLEYRQDGTANAILTPNGGRAGIGVGAIATGWAVRRLTPTECERLQGFPDGYTAIPFRGKPAADGPRYKALGNSMAVNAMRWIGQRIDTVDRLVSIPQLQAAE